MFADAPQSFLCRLSVFVIKSAICPCVTVHMAFYSPYSPTLTPLCPSILSVCLSVRVSVCVYQSSSLALRMPLAVGRHATQFSNYAQQDSHELLAYLLDHLHEACGCSNDRYSYMNDSFRVPAAEWNRVP